MAGIIRSNIIPVQLDHPVYVMPSKNPSCRSESINYKLGHLNKEILPSVTDRQTDTGGYRVAPQLVIEKCSKRLPFFNCWHPQFNVTH